MGNIFLTSTRLFIIVSRYLVEAYYKNMTVSSVELSKEFRCNHRALVPMLNRLTRMGYMHSKVGGSTPGHKFVKDPKEISLGEIIEALEGKKDFDGCYLILQGVQTGCTPNNRCAFCRTVKSCISEGQARLYDISLFDLHRDSI